MAGLASYGGSARRSRSLLSSSPGYTKSTRKPRGMRSALGGGVLSGVRSAVGSYSPPEGVQSSGVSTDVEIPDFEEYTGIGRGDVSGLQGNIDYLAEYGRGMMDPESAYYQQLSDRMARTLGQRGQAQQRASALRAAWGGYGAGASPEQMMTAADIGQSTLEAQGQAEADLRLQAPQIGAGMLSSTFQPQLGLEQLLEGSQQFGANLAEGARQYGGNVALQQQGMANQMAQFQAQMDLQRQMAEQEAMLRELQMLYGGMM